MNEKDEIQERIKILYKKHYTWLLQYSTNVTRNRNDAEDMIGDLMIYLLEKGSRKIFYRDSFNLMYCARFISSRWINKIHKSNKVKIIPQNDNLDIEDIPYDIEGDERMMKAYDLVQDELERLVGTKDWAKAKLFNLYYESDDTMLEVANKIGICKSSMFSNVKKIREHLKNKIENPFIDAK
jgi:RNA polymerase sigma factor (sigma-70 family)